MGLNLQLVSATNSCYHAPGHRAPGSCSCTFSSPGAGSGEGEGAPVLPRQCPYSIIMATGGQSWQRDAADRNFDYMFKLLIIGNSSVGKTSFLILMYDVTSEESFSSVHDRCTQIKT